MKTKFSKLIAVLLTIMMLASSVMIPALAEDEAVQEKFTYTLDENGYATITGVEYSALTAEELKNFVIPSTVGGSYPVKNIAASAFAYWKEFNTLVVSEGVESIGDKAFLNNNTITSLTLPSTLKTIGASAFEGCNKISRVVMPSCETIGAGAFYNCSAIVYFNSDYLGECVLPSNLKTIGNNAFRTTNAVESVILPESLETVGSGAFYRASNVSTVYFPETMPEAAYDKEFVGGFAAFKTVDAFGSSKSYIKTYADSEEAVDVYLNSTTENSNNRLYNYIEENGDIIVYDESFTNANGTGFRGTKKDLDSSGVGFKARLFNVGTTDTSLKAIITVSASNGDFKGFGEADITVGAYSGYTLEAKELVTEGNIEFADGDIISVIFCDGASPDKIVVTRSFEYTFDNEKDEILVMAIGNSFSQDSITYLKAIAAADGVNISPYNCYVGGRTLQQHYDSWNNEDAPYQIQPDGSSVPGVYTSSKDMVKMYAWDYVVVQGTTHNTTYDTGLWGDNATTIWTEFANGVAELAPNAKRLVHATWAPYNELSAITNSGMFASGSPDARGAYTMAVMNRYQLGADIYSTEKQSDNSGALIPTAVAVDYLIRHYGFPEYIKTTDTNWNAADTRGVYRDTTCHLTDNVGRVLAGLVWYEMITGTPATQNAYTRSTISDKDMAILKEAAHYACQNYATYVPEVNKFKYTVDENGYATITGVTSEVTTEDVANLVIPSTVAGYPVKSIGASAFGYWKSINTLVVSEGVESIGDQAFINNVITSLTLPSTLKTIGANTFSGCTKLSKVVMPSCETIGGGAFYNCPAIAYFNSDYYGEIVLPDNLVEMGASAFQTCNAIKTVILPDSLSSVSGNTFYRASGVNTIYFPGSMSQSAYVPTFVGGFKAFKTVKAIGSSDSYIKTYAESADAYDKYNTSDQSGNKLYNFFEENGDVIVLSGSFTNGSGTALKGTETTTGTVGYNGRIFNVSTAPINVTAIIAVMGTDGTLEAVQTKEYTLGARSGCNVSYKDLFVENIDLSATENLKVMFWDDLTNIKPLQTHDIELAFATSAQ